MKKINIQLALLLIVFSIIFAACSTGSKGYGSSKRCGCGVNKGYVGY